MLSSKKKRISHPWTSCLGWLVSLPVNFPYNGINPSRYREGIQSRILQVAQNLYCIRLCFSLSAHSSAMPMRSQIPWSETLLNSASKTVPPAAQSRAPLAPNLVPRRMQDSYTELTLPFGSSSQLLEQYTNASGGIRTGKLVHNLSSET